jgi:hypothetical protein
MDELKVGTVIRSAPICKEKPYRKQGLWRRYLGHADQDMNRRGK